MKTRPLIILGAVVLVIVAAAAWFLQNSSGPVAVAPSAATPAPANTTAANPLTVPPTGVRTKGANPFNGAPGKAATPAPLAEWEIKIDQVLNAKANETETAQMLINLLPTLPPEGQAEAAQHITNLIVDKDYNRVLPLLRNAALPEEVQDVLVTDLMNREDPVKLPALLDVAKIPNHPYHEEALNDLQIFLDQDDGTNWSKWDGAVKDYLKKQQAEQANDPAADATAAPAK